MAVVESPCQTVRLRFAAYCLGWGGRNANEVCAALEPGQCDTYVNGHLHIHDTRAELPRRRRVSEWWRFLDKDASRDVQQLVQRSSDMSSRVKLVSLVSKNKKYHGLGPSLPFLHLHFKRCLLQLRRYNREKI